jgi:hypothetical protein
MHRCLPDSERPGSPSRTIRQRGGEDSGWNARKTARAHHDKCWNVPRNRCARITRRQEILGIASAAA